MESLIPFIIMLLLGSLFSGKKKSSKKEKRPTKPFTSEQREQDNPIKKLKEMSRDLYKEIQQEVEHENQKVERPVAVPRESDPKVDVPRAKAPKQTPLPLDSGRRRETRREKVKRQSKIKQSNVDKRDLVPSNSDDIMKGIIYSEIIGPPKSKR